MHSMKKKIIIWILLDVLLLAVIGTELWVLLGPDGKFHREKEAQMQTRETGGAEEEILAVSGKEVTPSADPSPVLEKEEALSKRECAGQISQLLTGTEGKWEIYITDTEGDIVMEKAAGENIRAGDIEYFFMTHQVYQDARGGYLDSSAIASADGMLKNRDGESYEALWNFLSSSQVIREDQPVRMRMNIENESYPHTFWDESNIGYTSGKDGCRLLLNILRSAEAGEEDALKERSYLEENWNTGPISDLLRKENTQVWELASRNGDRVEDFSHIVMEDGTQYQIGIMVKNVADPGPVEETIGRIAELAHRYFSTRELQTETGQSVLEESIQTQGQEETSRTAGLEELEGMLQTQISGYEEQVCIYVKDLLGGDSLEITDAQQHKAASLIKLYVMASVYDQIQKGSLMETEDIKALLTNMITVSDNESTNELVRRLSPSGTDWEEGSAVTNAYIAEHGYTDTSMGRDVQDFRETPPPGENYTSVRDCGKILEEIYRGTCVSQEASREMLELLIGQQRRGKIPAGIASALYIANKTGELDDVQHDAAIIQLNDQTAYILCVMTDQVTDSERAVSHITEISKTVYDHFSSRPQTTEGSENV